MLPAPDHTPGAQKAKLERLANMSKQSRDLALTKLESIHDRMKGVTEADVFEALSESGSVTIGASTDTFEYDAFRVSAPEAGPRREHALTRTA